MFIRYTKTTEGKLVKQAKVYTQNEHGITLDQIDPKALLVARKLRLAGFEAYIVGGAVRDLLLGRKPKDFDVVTNAHPRTIRRIFSFSRIIGKRFRLVHVYCSQNKIIEVATFRGDCTNDNNAFGTLEQDAKCRDFSVNALYYSPHDQHLIDHVEGLNDIRVKRLRHVIDLKTIFDTDPMRMVRAIKYATIAGLTLPLPLAFQIQRKAFLLAQSSPSRLTEEFFKILSSGFAEAIFLRLKKTRLLTILFPQLAPFFHNNSFRPTSDIQLRIRLLDKEVLRGKTFSRSQALSYIVTPWLELHNWPKKATPDDFNIIIHSIKQFFLPIIPSYQELESILKSLFCSWSVRLPNKRPFPRKRRSAVS